MTGRRAPPRDLADDAAPHRFLERVDGLLLGPTAGGPDRREVERATDDGRRREDLRRGLADRAEPVAQERVDVARHRRARRLAARERGDDMERQPLRIAGERVDQRVVDRVVRSDGTDELRDRVARQPAEDETRGIRQPRQVGDHRLAAGVEILAAERHEEQERTAAEPAGEIGDGLARRVVGQVEVVDPDEAGDRSGDEGRQRVGDGLEQPDPRPGSVRRDRRDA